MFRPAARSVRAGSSCSSPAPAGSPIPGAEFAVHAWADEDGREANDYPADAPENRAYVDYYAKWAFPPPQARAFYAMTNSVPHADARWLTARTWANGCGWTRRNPVRIP
jgi:hypothetical protein